MANVQVIRSCNEDGSRVDDAVTVTRLPTLAWPECSSKQVAENRVSPTSSGSWIPSHLLRTARGPLSIIAFQNVLIYCTSRHQIPELSSVAPPRPQYST
jgi:hypothetical protein